jgi:inner membrane protein
MGALTVVVLVAFLQIPIALIRAMIDERVATREDALGDVRDTWGGAQSVIGPRLVVPVARPTDDGLELEAVSFLPATLRIEGNVEARSLVRGLFTVPVYDAELTMRGQFEPLELASPEMGDGELLWERASIVVELTEAQYQVRAALPDADLRPPLALRHPGGRSCAPDSIPAGRGRDVSLLPTGALVQ